MNDTMTRAGIASEQDVKEINAVAVRRPDLEADPRGMCLDDISYARKRRRSKRGGLK